ncbi:MAG: OOP family OmpA-OmpF porin, partial [Pseudohongiellaceae bacterium]
MKNLSRLFFVLLLVLSFNANAQDSNNPWKFTLGANAIDLYPVGED